MYSIECDKMVRISLKEAYDDRSVIKKIADLEANK